MKKVILGFSLLIGISAQAGQVPVFKCQVPAPTPSVRVDIAVSDSESIDYVTVDLIDEETTNLFMQMEKGQLRAQVKTGGFTTPVFGNAFRQGEDGVIRDAGFLALGLNSGKWSGVLSFKNSIYSLECISL